MSIQGKRILNWMYKNIKYAKQPETIEQARENISNMAKANEFSGELMIQTVHTDLVNYKLVYTSCSLKDKYIFYLHGGGYCMGSTESSLNLIGQITSASGCRVLSVDYRLAPENPFPAALDDAECAYLWLINQNIEPENIIIVGESAGGGLALSLMLKLRDKSVKLPKAAVLLSPWTDLTESGDSYKTCSDTDPFYNINSIDRKTAEMYSGNTDLNNPFVSPLFADLSNLPDMLIQTGTNDVLYNDSTRLEKNLIKSGVNVNLRVYEEMWHVWHMFGNRLPEAEEAVNEIGEFIKDKLNII
ncbi:MAG: alpha/beta hydrolase [Clostridium sp.]